MKKKDSSPQITRRQLLAGAGTLAGSSLLPASQLLAQQSDSLDTTVFTNTSVVTNDPERRTLLNTALAVQNDVIAAIGETDEILARFPNAQVYDGRRKALLPGLVNCHAHLAATIAKGFNEDFGFPNSLGLSESPESLLSAEEATVMSVLAAVE